MTELPSLLILPLSIIGFVLKGIASFGPGIVMVPIGAMIFNPRDMVLLSGCLDLISNIILFRYQRRYIINQFCLGMVISMVLGACLGAVLLSALPVLYFNLVFGLLLVSVGIWTIINKNGNTKYSNQDYPLALTHSDILVSFISGCMSGLSGITAPILAWYLNRKYDNQVFREIMIPLLLASASSRVLVYGLSSELTSAILPLLLLALPGLLFGLWLGNRLFLKISQRWLSIIIGSLVTLSGIKLLFR